MADLKEIAVNSGRMLEIAILSGNKSRALEVVNHAFQAIEEMQDITEKTSVADVLTKTQSTVLEYSGIETIGDVIQYNATILASITGLRIETVRRINERLKECGFALRAN